MRTVLVLLMLVHFCDARPSSQQQQQASHATGGGGGSRPRVIGGADATPGEFPWQLSQERQGTTGDWVHHCGASLLSAEYALSAAHCVDGASPSILRVWAGLHDRTDTSSGVVSMISSFKIHEEYGIVGQGTYPNDIAILTLETPINANSNIGYLTLPVDNSNDFAGSTCSITGWGRTSAEDTLSPVLQTADITVISTDECNQLLSDIPSTSVTDTHICVYDPAQLIGSCTGDNGGPLNCQDKTVVAGVSSWGIVSGGTCQLNYPSVYTRTGAYLDWIASNTP